MDGSEGVDVDWEQDRPAVVPELLTGPEAARLCGMAPSTWRRLVQQSKAPGPIREELGCLHRWRRSELMAWIRAGCPAMRRWRQLWEAES